MAGKHRFCSKCNRRHVAPVGTRCRLPPPDLTDETTDEVGDADEQQVGAISMPVSYTAASASVVEGALHSDDRIETLITIVSDLVLRMYSTQRQIDNLQSQPARSIPPASYGSVAVLQPSSGLSPRSAHLKCQLILRCHQRLLIPVNFLH
jgi:hypothetical protein